ncbi:hypothetical protein DL768_001756 [Monosporascus sp. mg162]|nr:hypothetical protein DL768_001756 [Monosporascus sp. mg162]
MLLLFPGSGNIYYNYVRLRYGYVPDANIRAAIAVFEAAADFESDDEDFEVVSNAALRIFRSVPERAFTASARASVAAAAFMPLAVPVLTPASVGAPAASVAASDPAAITLLTRVAAAVEQLAVNVAAVLVKLRTVAARARTGYDDDEEEGKEKE